MSRLTLPRQIVVASVAFYVIILTPASACAPTMDAVPSRLDYVVLASLADSSTLLAMSTSR